MRTKGKLKSVLSAIIIIPLIILEGLRDVTRMIVREHINEIKKDDKERMILSDIFDYS